MRVWGRRQGLVDQLNAGVNDDYLPGVALPSRISASTDPAEVTDGAEIVVLSVPSQSLRDNLTGWAPLLGQDKIVVSLMKGIEAVRPGATFGDIGAAIQTYAEGHRMSVVRDFCGHGIGRVFHDTPNVLHYGRRGEGAVLKPGMIFTVEPMVNLGKPHVKVLSDGWTAVTRDKSLSAQCEHSVGVTEDGVEIFTLSPAGLFRPN